MTDPIRDADLRRPRAAAHRLAVRQHRAEIHPAADLSGGRSEPSAAQAPGAQTAAVDPAAGAAAVQGGAGAPSLGVTSTAAGVEINFEGANIQAVAKTLLADTLGLNFSVDTRVQGSVTLVSAAPIPRKDLLAVFESVLRMSNAGMVRERQSDPHRAAARDRRLWQGDGAGLRASRASA